MDEVKKGFRITIRDLDKVCKHLKSKMKPFGAFPTMLNDKQMAGELESRLLIDGIVNRLDQEDVMGPRLTIVANDREGRIWSFFDGIDIEAELLTMGWYKVGDSIETCRVVNKGKPLMTGYRHKDEDYLVKRQDPRCLMEQFWIMHKLMGGCIVVIHDDIEYMMQFGGKPAGVEGLVWQIMQACPSVMAMASSFTQDAQAIDFVHKYLYNRHGALLTPRNVGEIIKLENKGSKAPVRDVMKPKAKIRKKDMAADPALACAQ